MSTVVTKNVQVGTSGTPAQNFTLYQPATPDGTVRLANGNSGSTIDLLTVNAAGAITQSAATANGVMFANGSKVLTTGSALTFDGTNFGVGTAPVSGYKAAINGDFWQGNGAGTIIGTISNNGGWYDFGASNNVNGVQMSHGAIARWMIGGSEQMRLTSTGLGIGTSSPTVRLSVATAASTFAATFQGSASTNFVAIGTTSFGASINGYTAGFGAAADLVLQPNGGNLGLGVTPSAWGGGYRAIDVQFGAIANTNAGSVDVAVTQNAFFNGSNWITKYSGQSKRQVLSDAGFVWHLGASQTAGNAISFTQAMTLDASGNLVVGATATGGARSRFVASTSDAEVIRWDNSAGSIYGVLGVSTTNSITYAGSATNNAFAFITNNTERARIDSSGNLLLGTTSNPATGRIGIQIGSSSDIGLAIKALNNGNWAAGFYNSSGTNVGSIVINSSATAYNTTSDYRLKTVIGPVADAGQRIDALQPVEYTWNASGERTRGFLAHQFQEVYAGSVSGTKDAVDAEGKPVYQSMQASTSEVIADLVAEIKSLRQRLAAAGI